MITFEITADTDTDELFFRHPALQKNYGAILDMIAVKDFGSHTAEVGSDVLSDEDTEHPITGTYISALYFADSSRAAIDDNASTTWTDASSIEDAIRRYRENDISN